VLTRPRRNSSIEYGSVQASHSASVIFLSRSLVRPPAPRSSPACRVRGPSLAVQKAAAVLAALNGRASGSCHQDEVSVGDGPGSVVAGAGRARGHGGLSGGELARPFGVFEQALLLLPAINRTMLQ
jgi:hypothetical protein